MQNLPSKLSGLAPSAAEKSAAIAALVLAAATMVAVLSILDRTILAMAQTWYYSNTFNHGFLILPIAAFLAWRKRGELANAPVAPDWRGGVGLALGALLWLLGDASGTLIVQELSVIIILQALVLAVFGKAVFRVLLFPLSYLYFAVPFGLELIPPLQTVTAFLSVGLLKLVGIPVFSDGYLISIPGGDWYVADACSGIRYVISSLALGGLFAGMMYVTWWRRALVLVVAVVVPILANGVRAFGIILLAYLTDNKLATGVDHLIYGWFFFTLVSGVVLALGLIFRETPTSPGMPHAARPLLMTSLVSCLFAAIGVLFIVGAARAYGDYIDSAADKRTVHLEAPEIAGYRVASDDSDDSLLPVFDGADAMLEATYQSPEQSLHFRLGYYLSERRGAQAISFNHELPGAPETTIVGKGTASVAIGDEPISARYQRIFADNRGRIIWYWYWVDGRITGDPYFAKLLEAKAKLFGGRQAAAIIAVAADYRSDPAEAETALRDFARRSAPLYSALARAQLP
jgi:exosortase A